MMYAYSVSTKCLVVVAVVALAAVMSGQRALAQPGTVLSHQKISDTEGGFTGILDNGDLFGLSVASLGDLDGDGVGDLAVGANHDDDGGEDRGAVWILFLNTDGTVKSHQKISDTQGGFTGILDDGDNFGFSLASLGDLDGDGVADLAVGAIGDDDGGANRGAVWILFLNTDGTVKSHQKISDTQGGFTGILDDGDNFGFSLASLGDLDGDGVADLAVGAIGDDDGGANRGAVWILFLNTDGTVKSHQKISDTQGGFTGPLDNGDVFGITVASLGDLDGDGIGDLAVGAQADDDGGPDRGAVWILFLDGAREITPDSFSLFRGMLTGGGLSDLFASEDSWMTVLPGITLNQAERQVQLVIVGTSPTETPSELRIRVEAHAEINNIGQWIELWNYDTNSYEQVDFMIATTVDSIVEVSITTNPERFIQAGTKEMKAKISYKEAGIVLFFPWLISFDQTVWAIVP